MLSKIALTTGIKISTVRILKKVKRCEYESIDWNGNK